MKTFEEKRIEECIQEIKDLMRYIELSKNSEFRINRRKINTMKLPLYKLYHDAFKQGVYCRK